MIPQQKFWRLGYNDRQSMRADWALGEVQTDRVICPIDDGHQRQGNRLTDLSIVLPRHPVEDFVWLGGDECLMQDHVLELFQRKQISGFEVKPVKARHKRPNGEPPTLWELVVTGWAGVAPLESGVRLIDECHACGSLTYSAWTNPERLIDLSEWDGSDFFNVWPLRYIFVSSRVVDAISENKLSGAVLTPLEDVVFTSSIIPTLSGDRLSLWMPEERAHRLGDKWGIY